MRSVAKRREATCRGLGGRMDGWSHQRIADRFRVSRSAVLVRRIVRRASASHRLDTAGADV